MIVETKKIENDLTLKNLSKNERFFYFKEFIHI